jgi:nucleotide-binding universal stress UspA family protein
MTPAGQAMLRLLTGYPLPAVEALAKEADLTIPAHSQTRRVLLPVDGSEQSLEVVRKTASLLNVNGTEIHLLHVWKPALFANRWVKPEQRRHQEIQLRLDADRIFALSNAILARYGAISHHQRILKGDPAECIQKYADEIGADLMAVECGLGGPLRKFLRNSSYKIVESTRCPVFVVRVPDEEGAR